MKKIKTIQRNKKTKNSARSSLKHQCHYKKCWFENRITFEHRFVLISLFIRSINLRRNLIDPFDSFICNNRRKFHYRKTLWNNYSLQYCCFTTKMLLCFLFFSFVILFSCVKTKIICTDVRNQFSSLSHAYIVTQLKLLLLILCIQSICSHLIQLSLN